MGVRDLLGVDMKRAALALAAAASLVFGMGTAHAQVPDLPVPTLPPPPAELKPVLGAPSPLVFQACQAEATAISLLQIAYTLGGLPVNPGDAISQVRELSPHRVACGYFRISVVPPTCSVDGNIPPLPVTAPRPASLVASQVRAIEKSLNQLGTGTGYPASTEVYSQLGCG